MKERGEKKLGNKRENMKNESKKKSETESAAAVL